MLSILNKLTLQKELKNFATNNVNFEQKVEHNKNKTNNQTYAPLPESGIEPGNSCTQSGCITSAPPSQLRVSIEAKLFNCFDAMGRSVNKQSQICGPHIVNNFIFYAPQKNFGGAYSRSLVRPSVSPSVRPIRVRPITLLFEVGF